MKLSVAARSVQGPVKESNQDALAVFEDRGLFVVCDGMGGMNQGGFASGYAVDSLSRVLAGREPGGQALEQALRETSRGLWQLARRSRGLFWTGTTALLAWLWGDRLHLAHAGDSRAYWLVEGRYQQLTQDHTRAQEQGLPGDVRGSASMTRYVGLRELEPEVQERELPPEGLLLLCTDGLTKTLSEEAISVLLGDGSPEQACQALIEAALRLEARDNVSVVVVHWTCEGPAREAAKPQGPPIHLE